jgi:translocation and assembly module TamB
VRRLLAAPGFVLRAVLVAALLAGGVFVVLTRTTVGREGLRRSLEAAFAQQFAGTLSIDVLAGDLVGTLDAQGVMIRDARGDTVLTARRLRARPTLRGLVTRELELSEITLTEPLVRLHRDTSGTWNVAHLLRQRPRRARPGTTRWRFGAPVVRVEAGQMRVTSAAPAPAAISRGDVADVFNASYADIFGQATVEWRATRRALLVERLRFRAPGLGLTVEDVSGQYREQQRAAGVERVVGGLRLRSGDTHLQGRLVRAPEGPFDAALDGNVDLDGLRALLPRLPLAGVADLDAEVSGTLESLTLERLRIATARSRIDTRGRIALTQDSIRFDASHLRGFVRGSDLATLWAEAPREAVRIAGTGATLDLAGLRLALDRTNPLRFFAASNGQLTLPAGSARGRASLAVGALARWDIDLHADDLDLERLAGQELRATRLSGRIVSSGRAPALDAAFLRTADTRLLLTLGPSRLAGRALDSLLLDGTLRQRRAEGRFALRQGASRARGTAGGTLYSPDEPFRVRASLDHFDAGALLGTDTLRTRLTGTLEAELSGRAMTDAGGEIVVDFSDAAILTPGRTMAVRGLYAALERDAAGQGRLALRTPFGVADVRGTMKADALQSVLAAFGPRLAARARSLIGHRRHAPADATMPAAGDVPPVQISATVTIHDAGALATMGLPFSVPDALSFSADVRTDDTGLHLRLAATADTLRFRGRRISGVQLMADVRDDGRTVPTAFFEAEADSVQGVTLLGSPLTVRGGVSGATGTLALRTRGPAARDGAILRLALLPDRLRLYVDSLSFGADAYRFTTRQGMLDVYADAAVVEGVVLEANAPDTRQRLTLDGVVSALPSDTLHLRAAGVDLGALVAERSARLQLGGRLDADIALTGLLATVEAGGVASVSALTLGRHVMGDLRVTSDFRPGEPEISLRVQLAPARSPAPGFVSVPNQLEAQGSYRFAGGGDSAAFNLLVERARVDAFFFDYLFPDLLAGTTGTIRADSVLIRGDPRQPQFTGTFTLDGGRLRVPRFGLSYSAEGTGHLSGDGLVLDDIVVQDGTGGSARVSGSVEFNAYRFISLDLQAALSDVRLLDVPTSNDLPFYGRLWASGTASLAGPVDAAVLRTPDVVVSSRSEVFIPIRETFSATDPGFIVHADSAGRLPDLSGILNRTSVFRRPSAERSFESGLTMDLGITAPSGSRVNLVIDPLRGDVMRARGAGALQLRLREGEFTLFGTLDVEGGDYLFTAGDLFARQFRLDGGTLIWDGDPLDPRLDVNATYRTRASLSGLADAEALATGTVPLVVRLELRERLQSPAVTLALALDRAARADPSVGAQTLETFLNTPERRAEYATSVLLTNSFLLTTNLAESGQAAGAGNQLAFTSLSELVSSQLNRYLSAVVPGLELRVGVEGERTDALDLTYGVALRLLDERLIIRGEGVLAAERTTATQGIQGEFVVEVRLSPAVSVEVFYRREDDVLQQVTASAASTTGASLAYQARFASWRELWHRLTGRGHVRTLPPQADSSRASDL